MERKTKSVIITCLCLGTVTGAVFLIENSREKSQVASSIKEKTNSSNSSEIIVNDGKEEEKEEKNINPEACTTIIVREKKKTGLRPDSLYYITSTGVAKRLVIPVDLKMDDCSEYLDMKEDRILTKMSKRIASVLFREFAEFHEQEEGGTCANTRTIYR